MKVVVVASGELDDDEQPLLDGVDLLIAADGGAASLDRSGRRPDLLVGDLDSTDASLAGRLEASGTRIDRHRADKEASDTELALEAAFAAGADEVVLLGGIGGDRLDHALANVLLLADPALADGDVRLVHRRSSVRVVHGGRRRVLHGAVGDIVTLLPIGGDACGVTTEGLRWPLEGATLRMGRSRGLSNEIVEAPASVALETGTLLVVERELERGAP